MLPDKYVITIGRTFGSGGRELGRKLAERLGIGFYDKELLVKAAEKAGYNIEYFENADERVPRILGSAIPFSMGFYPISWLGDAGGGTDRVYKAQCDFINDLADNEPCVIVGRSADYILRKRPNVINIFVHAPVDVCAKRIVERSDTATHAQAKALAERTNKLRANFYNFYTDKEWGNARSYDLCFDSSLISIDDIAEIVVNYLHRRLDK